MANCLVSSLCREDGDMVKLFLTSAAVDGMKQQVKPVWKAGVGEGLN